MEIRELPDDLFCPVLHTIFEDPVFNAAGHTYERRALEDFWAESEGELRDPWTNEVLTHAFLAPNLDMRRRGSAFLENWRPPTPPESWRPTPPSSPRPPTRLLIYRWTTLTRRVWRLHQLTMHLTAAREAAKSFFDRTRRMSFAEIYFPVEPPPWQTACILDGMDAGLQMLRASAGNCCAALVATQRELDELIEDSACYREEPFFDDASPRTNRRHTL